MKEALNKIHVVSKSDALHDAVTDDIDDASVDDPIIRVPITPVNVLHIVRRPPSGVDSRLVTTTRIVNKRVSELANTRNMVHEQDAWRRYTTDSRIYVLIVSQQNRDINCRVNTCSISCYEPIFIVLKHGRYRVISRY